MINNTEKITRDFCKRKILVFFPRTLEEAEFIQRKIFEMGFKWGKGTYDFENGSAAVQVADLRLLEGLVLDKEGKLFSHPIDKQLQSGLLCDSTQFDEAYMSPQQQMMERFNRLAASVREISQKVDEMYKQIMPQKLDKSIVKKPETGSP